MTNRIRQGLVWRGIALVFALAAIAPLAVLAQDTTPEATAGGGSAFAALQDANGNAVGEVSITQADMGQVIVQVLVNNLPPGFHGFHIHETGQCDPATEQPFSSAGAHLNLDGSQHPNHSGDLPALYVLADGTGGLLTITDRFSVSDLLDEDGSAIVIHQNADNFTNIPERYGGPDEETLVGGDSGARLACGVIAEGLMEAVG
ncbi:MAG: superoxide dismutase family protein [Chloroflexota bacterium]|nr:MAG: superoxide dismutase [Chloroflexota bacterium]